MNSLRFRVFNLCYRVSNLFSKEKISRNKFKRVVAHWLSKWINESSIRFGSNRFYYRINSSLGFQLFFHGAFERETIEYCDRFIRPDSIVFDIGANIGIYSFHFAPSCSKGCIFAFEPGKDAFQLLAKNCLQFNNVSLFNLALSSSSGVLNFYETTDSAYSSLKDTERARVAEIRRVPVLTLDSIVDSLKLSRIDFVKVDVEGFEAEVINGARQTLLRYKPVLLIEICERNMKSDPEVLINEIISLGYTALIFGSNGIESFKKHDDNFQNYLFQPVQ